MPRVVAVRDVIDVASSLCRGMQPGATSSAELFVAPLEVARCGVVRGVSCCAMGCRGSTSYTESFVVSQGVAGRMSLGSTSSAEFLTSCRGSSPCATSSTEFLHRVVGRRRV